MNEKLVKLTAPVLAENHTPNDKRVWEYHMGELMKTERFLVGILYNLFAILMSLCDSDMKNHIEISTEYAGVEEDLDSLRLLALIKKLVFTGRTYDLHLHHNKALANIVEIPS